MKVALDLRVHTAMVSDSLDDLGIRNNVMDGKIRPLQMTMRAVGTAATIKFVPDSEYDKNDPYGAAIDFLDTLEKDNVVVIGTGGGLLSAFWGELFSAASKARGATGVVTDGPIRDTQLILKVGFDAFGVLSRPLDYKGRMRVESTHQPTEVGGVLVHPGDGIVADNDGIVVVPRDLIDKVFSMANERAQKEKTVLNELTKGRSVRSVWDEYRLL